MLSLPLSQSTTLNSVLAAVGDRMMAVTGADRGLLISRGDDASRCAWSRGISPGFFDWIKQTMQGYWDAVHPQGHPTHIIPDIQKSRILTPQAQEAFLNEGIRALAVWPVYYEGGNFIAIGGFFNHPHRPRREDLLAMRALMRQASAAVENALLFEALQAQVQGTLSLNRALTPLFNPQTGLDNLVRQIVQVVQREFSSTYCSIYLYDEFRRGLRQVAEAGLNASGINFLPVDGPGLTVASYSGGEMIYAPDVRQDPRYLQGPPLTRCELVLPLRTSGRVLGVLNIESQALEAFDESTRQVLASFAERAGLALENCQLFELARRHAQEAGALSRAAAALTSSLDINQVLRTIFSYLEQVVPYDSACVFLRHGDRLSADAGKGISPADGILGTSFPVDNPFFQEISATGKPLVLFDAQVDQRLHILGKTSRTRAWMGIPLIAAGSIIGVLTLESFKTGSFKEEQAGLAQAFTNQAAAALQNARLYEDAQRRLREWNALHVATTALQSTLDIQVLIRRILEAAASAVPAARRGRMIMANQETGDLLVQSSIGYPPDQSPDGRLPEQANFITTVIQQGHPVMNAPQDGIPGAIIVAPLLVAPQVYGAISLETPRPGAFTSDDLELLVSFASTAIAAIRSATLYAEVEKMALTDPLTELYNRRGFFDLGMREFERALRYGHPLACIMIDIDLLKAVNDTYGHAAGDQVLIAIARQFRLTLRKTDIFGRFGGDEFAILLPETALDAAQEIADRLRENVARNQISFQGARVTLSISLGVAALEQEIDTLDALISRADEALLIAKHSGRNRQIAWKKGA